MDISSCQLTRIGRSASNGSVFWLTASAIPAFCACLAAHSISLEQARQAQDDGGGGDPAHDDEDHTPHLSGAVHDPGIAYVETDDREQEVEGVEERLEGWLNVGFVGRSQLTPTWSMEITHFRAIQSNDSPATSICCGWEILGCMTTHTRVPIVVVGAKRC